MRIYDHVCEVCGKSFQTRKPIQQYCSRDCANRAKRTGANPHYQHICRYCGKEWTDYYPVRTHCSRKCRDDEKRNCITLTCEVCQTPFTAKAYRTNIARFCSRKCMYTAKRTKVTLICSICGGEYRRDPTRAKQSRYCSPECQAKGYSIHRAGPRIARVCEFCGEPYKVKPSSIARARFCSASCRSSWVVRNFHGPTSIERAIDALLDEMGIPHEAQKPIGKYLCDFFVPRRRLVIECDGEYWHGNFERIHRDVVKDAWLKSKGYRVLRLPEQKIVNDLDWCRARITALVR